VPISIVLIGSYHDIGAFAGDVAALPRIVTLNDLNLTAGAKDILTLRTTAKTFRYLDQEELAKQKKPAAGAKK
jgi:type IV pilus assembly protein PilO